MNVILIDLVISDNFVTYQYKNVLPFYCIGKHIYTFNLNFIKIIFLHIIIISYYKKLLKSENYNYLT